MTTHLVNVITNPTPNAGTFYPVPTDASLRAAINAANSNSFASNTIVLGAGIYTLTNTALGQLVIQDTSSHVAAKTLTIIGPGSSSTTIEPSTSRGWTDRIFEIVSKSGATQSVVFRSFTIAGGFATGGGILGGSVALGGGVLIDGGTVSMTNIALLNNQAVAASGAIGAQGQSGAGRRGNRRGCREQRPGRRILSRQRQPDAQQRRPEFEPCHRRERRHRRHRRIRLRRRCGLTRRPWRCRWQRRRRR